MMKALALVTALFLLPCGAAGQDFGPIEHVGNWQYSVRVSALDGVTTVALGSPSTNTMDDVIRQKRPAQLLFLCDTKGMASVAVSWPNLLSGRSPVTARYRLDEGPVQTALTVLGSTYRQIIFEPRAPSERLAREIAGAKKMVVQAGTYEAIFDITGADIAIPRALAQCGVK